MRTVRASRLWLVLLANGAFLSLISCAATPSPDPWATIEPDTDPVAEPVELVAWPAPVAETDTTVTFDLAGAVALRDFQIVSEGNYEIGSELSAQVTELKTERDALVAAGKGQRAVSDLRLEILEEERRSHMIEKVGYWIAMGLLLVGVAVL